MNVSVPTSLFLQSNHLDAQTLESQTYTITNNSIIGVHVDVDNFRITNYAGTELITSLNIVSTVTGAIPVPLISNSALVSSGGRLLSLPGTPASVPNSTGDFRFNGISSVTTQTANPEFELTLRFEVANIVP